MKNNIFIYIGVVLLLIIGVAIGWIIKPTGSTIPLEGDEHLHSETSEYTCSMHPEVRQPEPGKCPLCGMELIPVSENAPEENNNFITLTPEAEQRANLETMLIKERKLNTRIKLTGKIEFNEKGIFTQSSHMPGRIDELKVNSTGEFIKKGQVIAYVYSPELVTAQEELFLAIKNKDQKSELYQAAMDKLRNWKLTSDQIDGIKQNGKPIYKFPVLADKTGYILKKYVNYGDHLMMGEPIFEIADLSTVWVNFEIPENDLNKVNTGDEVVLNTLSNKSNTLKGKVSYIDPVFDESKRAGIARVVVSNTNMSLRPGMNVEGILSVSNKLGNQNFPVVPRSAVLWTGKRSVVYIKVNENGQLGYKMREVEIGTSMDNGYVINEGLNFDEEIVINGAFVVDAVAQLNGNNSMMRKTSIKHKNTDISPTLNLSQELPKELLNNYLNMINELAKDNYSSSMESIQLLAKTISETIEKENISQSSLDELQELKKTVEIIKRSKNIKEIRKTLKPLSNSMVQIAGSFKDVDFPIYIHHCPMADNDNGADWLSSNKEILNPYYGSMMLRCGYNKKIIN